MCAPLCPAAPPQPSPKDIAKEGFEGASWQELVLLTRLIAEVKLSLLGIQGTPYG